MNYLGTVNNKSYCSTGAIINTEDNTIATYTYFPCTVTNGDLTIYDTTEGQNRHAVKCAYTTPAVIYVGSTRYDVTLTADTWWYSPNHTRDQKFQVFIPY